MGTELITTAEMDNIFGHLQAGFDQQFLSEPKPVKRNQKGEPLCLGFGKCEYKQEIAEQCDQQGEDSLSEAEQYLMSDNVCCCGEFENR